MAVELRYANALTGVIDRLQTDIDSMHQEGMLIFSRLAEETPPTAERVYTRLSSNGDPSGREAFYNENGFSSSLSERIAAIQWVVGEIMLARRPQPASFGIAEWRQYLPEKRLPQYDAIFVGGGPIALLTAIFAKVKNDRLSILILEKRLTYVRTHALAIDRDGFAGYPQGLHAGIDAEVTHLRGKVIAIQEVEGRLKQVALSLNIQIEYVGVQDPRALEAIFPETRMFIGADGANSVVRRVVFGDALRLDRVIERLVFIQYQVRDATIGRKNIADVPLSYSTISSMPLTLLNEHVGSDRRSKTLIFSVPNRIYTPVREARMSAPFNLNNEGLPEEIRRSFFLWCGMKEDTEGEVRLQGTEKITAVDGKAKVSRNFIKQIGDRRAWWALVGDAAVSLPLQRGFNTSARAAVYLAEAIVHCTINNPLQRGVGVDGTASAESAAYAAFSSRVEDLELCTFGCPLTGKANKITLWRAVTAIGQVVAGLPTAIVDKYINAGMNPGHLPRALLGPVREAAAALLQDRQGAQQGGGQARDEGAAEGVRQSVV